MDHPERRPPDALEPGLAALLIVDDEEDARLLLERIFDKDYHLYSAKSGRDAQQILQQHRIDIVVSDQRMPGMTGADLLAWTFEHYPDTVRILTTAHDDLGAAIQAINLGRIHRYITKPWDIDELRNVVRVEATTQQLQRANLRLQQEVAAANVDLRSANEALEVEIQRSEYWRRYAETILESTPLSLIALDEGLTIRSINKLPPQVRAAKDDLVGASLNEIHIPAEVAEQFVAGMRRVFAELLPQSLGMLRVPLEQSERRWSVDMFPIRDPHGEQLTLLSICDVTESHYLRVALIQSEKMASVGYLAAGVAHEFNNLIGGILGYAQLADLTGSVDDYKKTVQVVFEVSQRAKKIIGNLLTFSRRTDERKELIKITDLVDQVVTLVERRFGKQKIDIVREIDDELAVEIEVGQLQQALLQLLMSAQQAMPNGGQVIIAAHARGDKAIRLSVEDSGSPLTSEELNDVFEPFSGLQGTASRFSGRTKGVGLAVVQSLVQRLGGEIEVTTGPHGGCLFTITLPPSASVMDL